MAGEVMEDDELDPQIIALAKAIRKQETGGEADPYNSKNKQGSGAFGAYQFMPNVWKDWAKRYLGDHNAEPTRTNQNKVVYLRLKQLRDKGYNPAQIAASWYAGESTIKDDKWKTMKGVSKQGIEYDVPAYVDGVYGHYQEFKKEIPKQVMQEPTPNQRVKDTVMERLQGTGDLLEGLEPPGAGVSMQTEAALLREGVHPDEKKQEAWDKRHAPKQPTGYKDIGETQMQTYERVMGKEAAERKRAEQEKQRQKLLQNR